MKLGIYGGTFDPIHIGHLIMAQYVRDLLELDRVLFIPAAIPPHKLENQITDSELRWEMLRLAIKDNPHFEASRIELDRNGPSYTVDTLKMLQSIYQVSRQTLFLLMGADSLMMLHQWYQPHELFKLAQVVVFPRPEIDLSQIDPAFKKRYIDVKTPLLEISSSEIRQRVRQGLSVRYFVPESVEHFIHDRHLYK